jgi:hypothetical protein
LSRLARAQRRQRGLDLRDIGLVARGGVPNQRRQPVGRAEQNADPLRRGNQLSGADQRDGVFRFVRQLANLREIENPRSAFDRMHGPKDAIYQLVVDLPSAHLQGQKVPLHGGQVLGRFGQIDARHFVVKIDHRV